MEEENKYKTVQTFDGIEDRYLCLQILVLYIYTYILLTQSWEASEQNRRLARMLLRCG